MNCKILEICYFRILKISLIFDYFFKHFEFGKFEKSLMLNMRIGKIAIVTKDRMDERFQRLLFIEILIVFEIEKILKIC